MSREQMNISTISFIMTELERCPENSYAGLYCRKCEHIEKHKKLKKDWICQWCGNQWDVADL